MRLQVHTTLSENLVRFVRSRTALSAFGPNWSAGNDPNSARTGFIEYLNLTNSRDSTL
jgi:hypothetical protein